MVTNLFESDEPLRRSIRQNTIGLLDILSSFHRPGESSAAKKERAREKVSGLVSSIEIALAGGLISDMNAEVLVNELNSLSERIADKREYRSGYPALTSDFFEVDSPASADTSARAGTRGDRAKEERPAAENTGAPDAGTAGVPAAGSIRTRTEREAGRSDRSRPSAGASNASKPAVQAKKSKRQREILKVVKEKGDIGVKDAAGVVSGCSEKTLQRELAALVDEGVLKKEGKRRWTRYSFA